MSDPARPWIFSAGFDAAFILAPAFLVTAAALILGGAGAGTISPWVWLVLIVGVDVSHVYSTLFRTYLDKAELKARPLLYGLTPLLCWLVGVALYAAGSLIFWRVLAYAAVFHFVRQQYGFMMIYSRGDRGLSPWYRRLDKAAIYGATLFPLIWWHTHGRAFDWFVAGDFLLAGPPLLGLIAGGLWGLVLLAWCAKEIRLYMTRGSFNLPRALLLAGTAISWSVGIIVFNNDLIFTATNVIAHGIPYMALIWGYGRNQTLAQGAGRTSFIAPAIARLFTWKTVPLFAAALFGLAFLEEGLWDGLVWREHGQIFGRLFYAVPAIGSSATLVWLVPLLAMPQATHYVLDAFIWRMQTKNTNWKNILFGNAPARA